MATRLAQQLISAARSGDGQAQLSLAKLYLSGGEGLAANYEAALHWLVLAAQRRSTDADLLIAECVALDRAGSQLHRYMDASQRAAAQGHAAGHCALGDIYSRSTDAAIDLGKAQAAYRVAAEADYIVAARKLGLLLVEGSQRVANRPSEEAVHWLRSAAAAGDQPAVQALGELLWRNGDYEAAQWFEPDAQRGDLDAMYRLGDILCRQSDGERVKRGAYWLERAARKGHSLALWRYGRLHYRPFNNAPTGLPSSPLTASRLLKRAAEAGASEALWDLARIHEIPRLSWGDIDKAHQYLEQAANAGVCEAELELGKRLSRHKNDRSAWIAAGHWLSRAAEKGSSEARAILERIADRASNWPPATVSRQEEILTNIRDEHPMVAARLELAARFELSTREMVFINPLDVDRAWCIEVDLSRDFKRMPWRLVIIESADQRLALTRAREAFLVADRTSLDLTGLSTENRVRQLKTICLRLKADPSLFVRNWKSGRMLLDQ